MNLTYRSQNTIARPVAVSGIGYWSGLAVTVEFRPAPVESGITFVRSDLASQPRIPVRIYNRVDAKRRTTLANQHACVELVEHILAALSGLHIDNCEVWVDRGEMPGCDGSSMAFVERLLEAGIVEQPAVQPVLVVDRPIAIRQGDGAWIAAEPLAEQKLTIRYNLEYDTPSIGHQDFEIDITPDSFVRELAAARTFVLASEAAALHQMGLAKHVGYDEVLVFDEQGPIGNPLRFADECVRHKALDVVGDLAICGCDIVGQITAHRSGHALNARLVEALITEGSIHLPERNAA